MSEQETRPQFERHDFADVLDIRSDDRVILISSELNRFRHPDWWEIYSSVTQAGVSPDSAVIVDGVEMTRRTMESLLRPRPRLTAFVVTSIDHERSIRRKLEAMYPWSDMWAGGGIWTVAGRVLITEARGIPYGRDSFVDASELRA